VGLFKRLKLEHKRKSEAATQRYLAERYKAALEKAERLEGRIGTTSPTLIRGDSSSNTEAGTDQCEEGSGGDLPT
jgi:hypothetical protein